MPFEVEHIVPHSAGGATDEANLCLACPRCNRHKGIQVTGPDEETAESVPLFDPAEIAGASTSPGRLTRRNYTG